MPDAQPIRRRSRALPPPLAKELAGTSEDLAREWLRELLLLLPLPATAQIDLQRFAVLAPELCRRTALALGEDGELVALAQGAESHGVLSALGQRDPAAVACALAALRDVLWRASWERLHQPSARDVGDLAQRLLEVADSLSLGALSSLVGPPASGQEAERSDTAKLAARLRNAAAVPRQEPPPAPPDGPAPPAGEDIASGSPPGAPGASPPRGGVPTPEPSQAPESLWVEALEEQVARARGGGQRLALLLVELDDAVRLIRAGEQEVISAFAETVRSVLRQDDILALEYEGRAWIIARGTGRVAARVLASRIADTISGLSAPHGVPLRVSAGVAILGEDGQDADALIDIAEQERFAAAARGLVLVEVDPETG